MPIPAARYVSRAPVLALLAALAAPACSEYNRDALDSNNQGMALLRAGRFADAREKFQRASEEDRRFDVPLYNLALSYIRQKDWPNAIDALSRAISRNPNNADYHYQLGNAHYQIAADPQNADNSQGGAHYDQARTAFQAAVQRNRNLWMAHFRLGQVAEALDEPQQALRAYTDALTVAPRAYAAYARLGRMYMRNGLYTEAAQVLREGIRIAPAGVTERGQMFNILALTLERQNQREQAAEAYQNAIREDPQLVQALYSLGMLYAEMPNQRPQAIMYLQQFVEARGGNAPPDYLANAQQRLSQLQNPTATP